MTYKELKFPLHHTHTHGLLTILHVHVHMSIALALHVYGTFPYTHLYICNRYLPLHTCTYASIADAHMPVQQNL